MSECEILFVKDISFFFFSFQAKHIFELHEKLCPGANDHDVGVQLSCDGVKETNSTSVSLDVYSLKMTNCKTVYPFRLVRQIGKYRKVDNKVQLQKAVNDIVENEKKIHNFLADNPKRSLARLSLSHSSYHPCEYCFARGVPIRLSNKTRITWPPSTAEGEPRSRDKILDIINNMDNLHPPERKGILGRSIFLDVPNFDYVRDIPTEYLHSVCLGVVKKTVSLTFSVGENRPRRTERRLSAPSEFNALMSTVKTPREFPRRARDLDFAVFKGVEFRNIAIFYFGLVLDCIEEGNQERELWLYLAYKIRACVIPSDEFRYVALSDVEMCCKRFYRIYEHLFGKINCTYNTHVVCSHLTEMRARGPLTETSTFVFESFYGEMKNCFVPGTNSPLKQILQKVLLKRNIAPHCCKIPLHFSDHETSLQNDTIFYIWQYNQHNMYKIKEIIDDEHLLCQNIKKEKVTFEEAPELKWEKVGVYKNPIVDEDTEFVIEKKNVSGKLIIVHDLIITCPNNVLREK